VVVLLVDLLIVFEFGVIRISLRGWHAGMLIGADLMNLRKLRGLGAPIASIAGTPDGIFLAGIIAVLLA